MKIEDNEKIRKYNFEELWKIVRKPIMPVCNLTISKKSKKESSESQSLKTKTSQKLLKTEKDSINSKKIFQPMNSIKVGEFAFDTNDTTWQKKEALIKYQNPKINAKNMKSFTNFENPKNIDHKNMCFVKKAVDKKLLILRGKNYNLIK